VPNYLLLLVLMFGQSLVVVKDGFSCHALAPAPSKIGAPKKLAYLNNRRLKLLEDHQKLPTAAK
jgi:hypothetical protein